MVEVGSVPAATAELPAQVLLEHERAKVRALRDIGAALVSALDLDELLALIIDRISDVMDAERATLFLLDDAGETLTAEFGQGTAPGDIRLRVGEGLAGWVAEHGEAVNLADARNDARFDPEWDKRTGFSTQSMICVPMKNHQGRTIGVVQALNRRHGCFSSDDEALLSALASQAAVSIENSKLFLSVVGKNMELLEAKDRLERMIRDQEVLLDVSAAAASALALDDLFERVLQQSTVAMDVEAAAILIADEESGDLRFRAAVGGKPDEIKRIEIKSGQGISGWVAKHKQPQVINNVDDDARHSRQISDRVGYHPRSVLCVPLIWEDQGSGALQFLNKAGGRAEFNEDDLRLALLIAGQVASAIGRAQQRERRLREERLSAIGQFLSGMLHDLRTPMTVISGYVQLMAEEPSEEVRRNLARTALKQVNLVDAMTKETLAFARGDRRVLIRKVYLARFFPEVTEHLRRAFESPHLRFSLTLADKGVAYFDEMKVQRAIHNLARNSAQALAEHGGHIEIAVTREETSGDLLIRVTDDGPGIPQEAQASIFDSFATYGKHNGTGLGLALVQKVTKDHEGEVTFASNAQGTSFVLRLPQPQAESRSSLPFGRRSEDQAPPEQRVRETTRPPPSVQDVTPDLDADLDDSVDADAPDDGGTPNGGVAGLHADCPTPRAQEVPSESARSDEIAREVRASLAAVSCRPASPASIAPAASRPPVVSRLPHASSAAVGVAGEATQGGLGDVMPIKAWGERAR